MDPNETLKRIRQLQAEGAGFKEDRWDQLIELAYLFAKLDIWLSNGNMLPDDWNHNQR